MTPDEPWLQTALRADVVRRALRVAAVVGTILLLINHGDRLLAGALGGREFLKIALTYLVPYGVATYAAVGALRAARRKPGDGAGSGERNG